MKKFTGGVVVVTLAILIFVPQRGERSESQAKIRLPDPIPQEYSKCNQDLTNRPCVEISGAKYTWRVNKAPGERDFDLVPCVRHDGKYNGQANYPCVWDNETMGNKRSSIDRFTVYIWSHY
jgi:hypothetical protein